jgi:signal transduction histidine kinase
MRMDQLARRNRIVRYACSVMVAAAALSAGYAAIFEPSRFAGTAHSKVAWAVTYVIFVIAYGLTPADGATRLTTRRAGLLVTQSVSALILVWLYPSFIVTCLLVVVAWQFALLTETRVAFLAAAAQVAVLASIKCTGQTDAMSILIAVSSAGFQFFAVSAAQLARSEIGARSELMRANAELRAAHALLDESARNAERLRIARDLHDTMGHTLTTLTVHLDVASRLSGGPVAEHLACAREASGQLLDQVRSVVNRFRTQPLDLQTALRELTVGTAGVRVLLRAPADITISEPAQAEAIVRCVQEAITNTVRHAHAQELTIELRRETNGDVVITASDDGRGGPFEMGHGLAGMRERFELLGGNLAISSAAGKGFVLRGTLPAAESTT